VAFCLKILVFVSSLAINYYDDKTEKTMTKSVRQRSQDKNKTMVSRYLPGTNHVLYGQT